MKKIQVLCAAIVMLFAAACDKNEPEIPDEPNVPSEYEKFLDVSDKGLLVADYEVQSNKFVIVLNDGSKPVAEHAPVFVVAGANGNWFMDDRDTGKPSTDQTPTITVGTNGNWTIDGEDTGITASGASDKKNASVVIAVSLANNMMTFVFGNGKTIQLGVVNSEINIIVPEGGFVTDMMRWIRIEPTVNNTENATFRWLLDGEEVSDEKDLLYVFDAPGVYRFVFSVTTGPGKTSLPVTITVNDVVYVNGVQHVYEYLPAPGQYTNEMPRYEEGDTPESMAQKAEDALKDGSMICLGAYGGYVVMGFDHTIVNKSEACDFTVLGNGFAGNSEPGIIMVSYDADGTGLPDDEWYEIAGSAHGLSGTVRNYEITYHKPDPADGNIRWTDNSGGEGTIDRNNFHRQASYFPLWYVGNELTFKGTLLQSNARNTGTADREVWTLDTYDWGYADNQPNVSEKAQIDIDWAVDKSGNPVHLKGVDFIKVYTGVNQKAGWLGETSTEVSGVKDLHLSK